MSHGERLEERNHMKNFEEEIQEMRAMSEEELIEFTNANRENVWSFPNMTPPGDAKSIGHVMKGDLLYFYYMDSEGKLYYETDSGFRWKKRMEELRLKHRQKERASRG